MKKLNVAIIGQGRSGRDIHGAYLRRADAKEKFNVAAVVDAMPERRARAEEEYGCTVYSNVEELLGRDDIDLVINSSFSHMHYPITKLLLENGFNVVCEKPAAYCVDEIDDLINTAAAKGVMYNVFQQSRFAPYFRKIKEIIDSGVLGRLIEVDIEFNGFSRRWDWQTLQCFKAGSLTNTGPHPIDQALSIYNDYDNMPNVFCSMDRVNTYGDAEDYVKLILTSPGKPLIDISISSCDAYPTATYKIEAQYGGLKGNMGRIDWKYYVDNETPTEHITSTPIAQPDGTPAYCTEKLSFHEESWTTTDAGAFNDAVASYYGMIYDYLTEGKPMEITPHQVRQQIAIFEECHRQNPLDVKFS